MNERRAQLAELTFVGVVLVAALLLQCGGSARSRANETLHTALGATNAARDLFVQWDRQHQLDLVERASSREEGEAQLASYRKDRQAVVSNFAVAYSAIAAAATLVPLVDAGQRPFSELSVLVAEAVRAAIVVKTTIDSAMRGP